MKKGKRVECNHCGYVWIYKGNNPYWATCPRCLRKVRIKEEGGKNE